MTARRTASLHIVPRLLRVREAAAYVGLGETQFRELVDAGEIPQPTDKAPPRWKREHLDAYIDDLPLRGEKVQKITTGQKSDKRREVRAI